MKRTFLYLLSLIVAMVATGEGFAKKKTQDDPFKKEKVLLFTSGFENDTRVVARKPGSQKEVIVGTDHSVQGPNTWGAQPKPEDISTGYVKGIGGILTEGEDTLCCYARIVPDPTNPANKVIMFKNYDIVKGKTKSRVQADASGVNLSEFYQSVRVYLHPDLAALKDMERAWEWLTLLEWWNNPPTAGWKNPSVFRISLNLAKDKRPGNEIFFDIHGQDVTRETPDAKSKFTNLWTDRNRDLPIQFGKWMTLRTYYKEGNGPEDGRFILTVQYDGEKEKRVFDVKDQTRGTGKPTWGVPYFSPMKFYTAKHMTDYMREKGKKFEIYWDDLNIWKAK